MNWLEILLVAIFMAGLFAGGVLVARRPTFWFGLGVVMFTAAKPHLIKLYLTLTKRMPPEQEKAWRDCVRRGGKWNHIKRRCE